MLDTQLHAAQLALINTEEELQRTKESVARLSDVQERLERRLDAVDEQLVAMMCIACAKSARGVLFMPCLHALYCAACAPTGVTSCAACGVAVAAALPFALPSVPSP